MIIANASNMRNIVLETHSPIESYSRNTRTAKRRILSESDRIANDRDFAVVPRSSHTASVQTQ